MSRALPEAALSVIFTTSFVVALSGALMPGPVLALTISGAALIGLGIYFIISGVISLVSLAYGGSLVTRGVRKWPN